LFPLVYKKVINVIREEKGTAHSPLRVLTEDFQEYLLKSPTQGNPELSIINELLCPFLLSSWDLLTPEVAVLEIDQDVIAFKLSEKHNSDSLLKSCFGSKIVSPVSDFSTIISLSSKHDFNKFVSPVDFLKIGLFDIWVENDDRKPSNPNLLIKNDSNGFNFYAIDHCYIFSSQNYGNLNPNLELGVSFNESILYTDFANKVYKYILKEKTNGFDELNNYFNLSITKCKNNYQLISDNIPQDLGFTRSCKDSLYSFLFSDSRNKNVFTEFQRRFLK